MALHQFLKREIPINFETRLPPTMPSTLGALDVDSAKRRKLMDTLARSLNNSYRNNHNTLNSSFNINSSLLSFTLARSPHLLSSPTRDLAHFAGLEDRFCKDFQCCGKQLGDLHDLLQHFEENHVCLESDMDHDELPFEFESMDDMDIITGFNEKVCTRTWKVRCNTTPKSC